MSLEPDAAEIRVLGSLIEKQRTTPDVYPLTLNALRAACNQATNREPVVEYDEPTIRAALHRLSRRGWARLASRQGSRAVKYRHLLDEALGLADDEMAVLCALMLRGPQTVGELKQRSERLHRFPDLAAVQATLDRLADRDRVARLGRRPGQKEERYAQLLGAGAAEPPGGEAADARPPGEEAGGRTVAAVSADDDVEARLDRMAADVAALRDDLDALRRELGATGPSR